MTNENVLKVWSLTDQPNREAILYFRAVAASLLGLKTSLHEEYQVVLVVHAYESVLPFIQALDEVFDVRGIIMKESTDSLRPEYRETLEQAGYKILDVSKEDFKDGCAVEKTLPILDPTKKVILLDHGGYFAFNSGIGLKAIPNLHGVVEYAANGEHRYARLGNSLFCSVVSTAYSVCKRPSDEAAANAIVYAALTTAQHYNMPILEGRSHVGIIGLGTLGSAAARKLIANGGNVMGFDVNPAKTLKLRQMKAVEKRTLLEKSDYIFCATGNKALEADDYQHLKDGAVIFTVTSPDDELDLDKMISGGILLPSGKIGQMAIYRVAATGNTIFLPLDGQAPNTLYSSPVTSPTIYLPLALNLAAAIELALTPPPEKGLHAADPTLEKTVHRKFIEAYGPNGSPVF